MNLEEGVKVASFSKVKNDDRPEEASDDKYDSEEAADGEYDSEEAAGNKPYVDTGIDELIQRAEDDSDK